MQQKKLYIKDLYLRAQTKEMETRRKGRFTSIHNKLKSNYSKYVNTVTFLVEEDTRAPGLHPERYLQVYKYYVMTKKQRYREQ